MFALPLSHCGWLHMLLQLPACGWSPVCCAYALHRPLRQHCLGHFDEAGNIGPCNACLIEEMSAAVGLWARLPASALVQPAIQHPNKAAGSPPLARETPYSLAACLDVL